MKAKVRFIVGGSAWLGFLFVASGGALVLHLQFHLQQCVSTHQCDHAHHDKKPVSHPEHQSTHDSSECPTCFLLLMHAKSVTLELPARIVFLASVEIRELVADTYVIPASTLRPLLPRAPPV